MIGGGREEGRKEGGREVPKSTIILNDRGTLQFVHGCIPTTILLPAGQRFGLF